MIYDMEKTVVDIISYREKIGIEETKEVLINYLSKKDRNINKLMEYAKILGQEQILKTYLEVLTYCLVFIEPKLKSFSKGSHWRKATCSI